MEPQSLFSLYDHLKALSAHGDPLEVLERTVNFEYFRGWFVEGLGYGDGSTSSAVWADTAYRSQRNEAWLADRMLTSHIHRRKPKGKPMPRATAQANAAKSAIRAKIEHVFAHQKNRFGLFIRTIGLLRAEAKLTLANLADNFDRLIFQEKRAAAR
jgi:hypothetical protein